MKHPTSRPARSSARLATGGFNVAPSYVASVMHGFCKPHKVYTSRIKYCLHFDFSSTDIASKDIPAFIKANLQGWRRIDVRPNERVLVGFLPVVDLAAIIAKGLTYNGQEVPISQTCKPSGRQLYVKLVNLPIGANPRNLGPALVEKLSSFGELFDVCMYFADGDCNLPQSRGYALFDLSISPNVGKALPQSIDLPEISKTKIYLKWQED